MIRTIFSFLLICLCQGCGYYLPDPSCPPPPSVRKPITPNFSCTSPTVLPVVPDACACLGIVDLVDIALQNSPLTRAAWYQAKQAATLVGTARGAYLPSIELQGFWIKEQLPQEDVIGPVFTFRQEDIGFTISTSYLLYDFGGRNGNLYAAMAAMCKLCWQYNWEVQTVMVRVIQSYYNYVNALGTVTADEQTVEDNLKTLEAASARKIAGTISVADELQAKTNLLQAQIILEEARGILNVARATLIQALGLTPDTPLSISELPETIPTEVICQDMCSILEAAKTRRADLAALREIILQNRFQIRSARSALLPNITTDLTYGKESIDGSRFVDTYQLQFNLNVPIFSSFSNINALRQAQAALLEAQADLDNQELIAYLAAISDYYELIANQQVLKFSQDYLGTASENREVAFANYQAGITTIVEVMIANNALAIARKQLIDAKTNFLTSLANLAYDTGCVTVNDLCKYASSLKGADS